MTTERTVLVNDRVVVPLSDAMLRDGVADLRWRLRELVLSGARIIVVDIGSAGVLSSSAVAAMLSAHRACRARGGRLVIHNPDRRTLDLLRRTGLWRVLRQELT
ncbi:MAG: STAS domain-containing protein [Actinomycetales bacterium]|nr:STAS domain-containing protein [Actinomycetales bacterium]